LGLVLSWGGRASAASGAQGDQIQNIASVSASGFAPVASNPAVVTLRIPTPATIELLQYAPAAPGAQGEAVVQGAFATGAAPGAPFSPLPPPTPVGSSALAVPGNLPLVTTQLFHQGDPVFVRLKDLDQNLDRTQRESVTVTLSDDLTGDVEVVRLTEDGPDTGVFVGYLPSLRSAPNVSTHFGGALEALEKSTLTARYVDPLDASDAVSTRALFDPTSRVFDSRTGQPVNGAQVSVIDAATGQPATVFADDGVSSFPSTVSSGQSVTDGAGRTIALGAGEFRFPVLRPGSYRFEVKPPAGYTAPSKVDDSALQALPGAPFLTTQGSRGEAFAVVSDPSVHIDIPVDPGGVMLWVSKTASVNRVAVGDFLSYEIDVTNTDKAITAVLAQAVDTLPPGFRYKTGSTLLNGVSAPDPAVSGDGKVLRFTVGDLGPGKTAILRFVTQVGAAAQAGLDAVNRANATAYGGAASNLAEARVRVGDDFFTARTFLMGRVTTGECDARDGVGDTGVPGVRVLLEDGTFAVSDKKGLFHFEGVRQGTHVVQLDLDTLPEGYEAFSCRSNDRFAGRAYSQFVEVQGNTLWRADFHLRPKVKPRPPPPPAPKTPPPPPPGQVSIALTHKLADRLTVEFRAVVNGKKAPLTAAKLEVTLPAGFSYVPGSSTLAGAAIAEPQLDGQKLTYPLGTLATEWNLTLTLRAKIPEDAAQAEGTAQAILTGAGPTGALVATAAAVNVVRIGTEEYIEPLTLTIRPHFASFGTALAPEDRQALLALVQKLKKAKPEKIVVIGHTDSQAISKRSRKIFADNTALSLARAESVRKFIRAAMKLDDSQVEAQGKGESEPIADNKKATGRALNRRVEVQAFADDVRERTALSSVKAESGELTAEDPLVAPTVVPAAPPPAPEPSKPAEPEKPKARDGLLSPADGDLVADRVNAVQIRLTSWLTPALLVDGKAVDASRIGYRSEDKKAHQTIYTFIGVDFGEKGAHTVTVTGTDPFGNVRVNQTAHVTRTGEISTIRLVEADHNLADGKTPVRARLELLDASGDVIHGAIHLDLLEGNLKPLRDPEANLTVEDLAGSRKVSMTAGGEVQFDPVTTSGRYHATLQAGSAKVEVETWAQPKLRDWILVGLAEGTAGYNAVSGHVETLKEAGGDDNLYDEGRVAFYAKGQIKAKWLVTAAYDSARNPSQVNNSLFQQIDPQTYFTLYGDGSQQDYDAPSARKIYVKIERDQFYALFGDFDTGLTVTELSRYTRKLNGIKTELSTRHVEVNAFGAQTDQAYQRDELPADGTAGLYRLTQPRITVNSETVTLLTRNRFHSEQVIESRTMTRFIDYSIDYDQGLIFFREPIPSRDAQFNPITIVVEYETKTLGGEDFTLGGRAGVKFLDGRLRAGATAIHEGEGARKNDLVGADARFDLTDHDKLRAELAGTDSRQGGVSTKGTAFLAEYDHTSHLIDGKLYLREQQSAFGLGQQPFSETGTRKWGGEGAYHFNERLTLSAEAYRQDTYATGTERLFGQARLGWAKGAYAAYVGVLEASDRLEDGSHHDSGQLTAGVKWLTLKERLTLGLDYDQSVWGNGNADFPTRIGLHADYKLTQAVSLFAAEELTFGDVATTNNTRVGLRSTLWKGGTFSSSMERALNENADRVFGNIGLHQTWQLDDAWKIDAGAERSQTVAKSGFYVPNPAVPPASGNTSGEDFTAISAGATYQVKRVVWDSRGEIRLSPGNRKWDLLTGAVYERENGWAFSGKAQWLGTWLSNGPRSSNLDLRGGVVYRPAHTRWIFLDRLDLMIDHGTSSVPQALFDTLSGGDSWRVLDNLLANWRPRKDWELSLGYGAKYGKEAFGGIDVQGYTDQASIEVRHDVTEKWDVGARASVLHVWSAHDYSFSAGPSVGFSPAKNLWLGLGFNVAGYQDRDFSTSNYTAFGPWLRLRFKFDQDSVREAASWLNKQ
jgi:uncharacterized repeat protein (TIGR01451 family)